MTDTLGKAHTVILRGIRRKLIHDDVPMDVQLDGCLNLHG